MSYDVLLLLLPNIIVIFHRDSGKWGGPLETAVQDIVGSFAMIVVTYQIMQFFGPFDIEPTDICGSGG